MDKNLAQKLKQRLEKEKSILEEQLLKFAKQDVRPAGDWDTQFPKINGEAGDDSLEDQAKIREEFEKMLPIEFSLETRLKDTNAALEKINTGTYGVCENCQKKISRAKLFANPTTQTCQKCQNKVS